MINKVIIQGNVGKDPEQRNVNGDTTLSNFSICSRQKTKNTEINTWVRISCFGSRSDFAQKYIKKGMQVIVEGHINVHQTENQIYTSIVADNIHFCGTMSSGKTSIASDESSVSQKQLDQLPF